MAGGMGSRSDRPTLAERAAPLRRGETPPETGPPQLRHCWTIGPYGRLPALLLGWERRADGWHGRVVHPVEEADAWAVVEEWLPAERLERG